jgi:hypothetical protein
VSIGLAGGFAPAAGAIEYYVSESLGDDAWSGLLPEPNGAGEWDIGPHEYSPTIFADGFESASTSAEATAVAGLETFGPATAPIRAVSWVG